MTETKTKSGNKTVSIFMWLIIFSLLIGGMWTNYHYQMVDISIRIIAWIVLVALCLGIALLTNQGKKGLGFAKASRGELLKVVWPTRPETIRTTMVVIALVILLSLIIWGLDSFLLWAVGLLTGQRG